jgi:type II secretory pathway component PulC
MAPQFSMPPLGTFSEIAARPVFIPSRRPLPPPIPSNVPAVPPAPPQPPPAPPPPVNLTLVGIMIGAEGRYAVVRAGGSQIVTTLAEGQEIGGWTVFLILPDRIVLRVASVETEITFPAATSTQQGPAPAVTRPVIVPTPQLGQNAPRRPS